MYIIPKPKTVTKKEGDFCLSYQSRIVLSPGLRDNGTTCASLLKECMENWAGFSPSVTTGAANAGDIFLCLAG